ncbi:MAG: hypothetical protein Q9174_006788 [Haloplaca sp. 1 TL-2023]
MFFFLIVQALILTAFFVIPSHQVDIRIERTWTIAGEQESFLAATCKDVPPGVCCKPLTSEIHVTTKVLFRNLIYRDIASIWRDASRLDGNRVIHLTGCDGTVLKTQRGPGDWLWRQAEMPPPERRPAEGASYVRVPEAKELPPNKKISRWLHAQGVLGLIWETGRWFSTPGSERLLGVNSFNPIRRVRRDIRSKDQGTVVAGSPFKTLYPTSVELNGVELIGIGDGTSFKDGAGRTHNMTECFRTGTNCTVDV